MTMCPNTIRRRPAVACAHTLAQAWVHTTVPIMVKTKSPPSSRKTSCKSSPNLVVPRALSSTTTKRTGISNDRQVLIAKIQSELAVHQRLALYFFQNIDHFLLQKPVYRPFSRMWTQYIGQYLLIV